MVGELQIYIIFPIPVTVISVVHTHTLLFIAIHDESLFHSLLFIFLIINIHILINVQFELEF